MLAFLIIIAPGCQKKLLDKQPLSSISDATFWKTCNDATLARNGVYDTGAGFTGYNFWCGTSMVNLDLMAGLNSHLKALVIMIACAGANWLLRIISSLPV
ncbi:hypothetical protein [Mucilaginibacter gracilis]|uniref:hypothetical protein n=1 Tax=Mucilaginibacter gracilis TaxID=423350 RepID=UPI000EB3CA5F|nr:hypothetical protein [Mucilaginibacter gracilis]